jgi:hypothetical protein
MSRNRGMAIDPDKLRFYLGKLRDRHPIRICGQVLMTNSTERIIESFAEVFHAFEMSNITCSHKTLLRMLNRMKVDLSSIKACCRGLSLLLGEEVAPDHLLPGPAEVPLGVHLLQLHATQVGIQRKLQAIPELFAPFLVAAPRIKYGVSVHR